MEQVKGIIEDYEYRIHWCCPHCTEHNIDGSKTVKGTYNFECTECEEITEVT